MNKKKIDLSLLDPIEEDEFLEDGDEGLIEFEEECEEEKLGLIDRLSYIKQWNKNRYTVEIEIMEKGKIPSKAYDTGDAGFDLFTPVDIKIMPGEVLTIPLNFKLKFNKNSFGQIYPKSGLSAKGLQVMAGVVDSSYRGNVCVVISNLNWKNDAGIEIKAGEKVAQLIMHPYSEDYGLQVVEKIEIDTKRGDGGFNSTGSK